MISLSDGDRKKLILMLDLTDVEQRQINKSGELDDEVADRLRERCNERLDISGYDADYNLTTDGQVLQYLADKLFIG